MIASIFMIAFGGLLALSGLTALRRPLDQSISVGEGLIFKMTGAEPLPKSRFFKVFERGFHVLLSVFGCLLVIVGVATLFVE